MATRRSVLFGLGPAVLLAVQGPTSVLAQKEAEALVFQVGTYRLVLERTNVAVAEATTDHRGEPALKLELTGSARETLAEMTNRNMGREMTVLYGERVLSKPSIRAPILDGKVVTGGFSEADLRLVLDSLR